jgi:hypothetical protein
VPVATTALATVFVFYVADAFRTGIVTSRFVDFGRDESPAWFYVFVGLQALLGLLTIAVAAGMWLQVVRK